MSEKVKRCEVADFGDDGLGIDCYLDGTFERGDEVVVIPASEYERLAAFPQKVDALRKTCTDMGDFVVQVVALVKEVQR